MGSENSRIAEYCRFLAIAGILLTILMSGVSPVSAQWGNDREAAIKILRNILEQPFLVTEGVTAFDCSITSGTQPTHPFTCDFDTAAGHHYHYLLIPDPEQGLIVDLATEPAAQLDYE